VWRGGNGSLGVVLVQCQIECHPYASAGQGAIKNRDEPQWMAGVPVKGESCRSAARVRGVFAIDCVKNAHQPPIGVKAFQEEAYTRVIPG
jgi:hypothetical protein